MNRIIIFLTCLSLSITCVTAQQTANGIALQEFEDPDIGLKGTSEFRSEFISYGIREIAEKEILSKNEYYLPLEMEETKFPDGYSAFTTEVDIPYMWLDRDLFIQISGLTSYYIQIGDIVVGYGEDSRTPLQFNISKYIKDGINKIVIAEGESTGALLESNSTAPASEKNVFLFSQPKLRIEDYNVTFYPDPTEDHGILEFHIAVSNSYNSQETITVGYDIYAPQGKLLYYDFSEVQLSGQGRDTVRFRERIYKTNPNFWTPDNPKLYHGMLTVKKNGRMLEYIPYNIGFGKTDHKDGTITRNGKPIDIKAVRYNTSGDKKNVGQHISAFKKHGYNTICTDYPQPIWFYDICDKEGIYVIDQANINFSHGVPDRNVGGTYSNAPAWLGSFIARNESAYNRVKNRTCVIGWSIGGEIGNGYNMYETYLKMKYTDLRRAVIFNDAAGEWNTDMLPVTADDSAEVLARPLPQATKKNTRKR